MFMILLKNLACKELRWLIGSAVVTCTNLWPAYLTRIYHQVSNTRRTLVGNKIVDHSYVVGASPVGAAPTTSSFST